MNCSNENKAYTGRCIGGGLEDLHLQTHYFSVTGGKRLQSVVWYPVKYSYSTHETLKQHLMTI